MAKWDIADKEFVYDGHIDAMDQYQGECKSFVIYPKAAALEYTALGLANESGEYVGHVKKRIRDRVIDDVAAAKELGDVLFYLAMSADALGYSLSEIADMNLDKLRGRKERGTIGGSGDER